MRPPERDPLILDLDGDGLELISSAQSDVNMDLDGDGYAERVGWVAPDDGLLVNDQNANGIVDGASELFGSATQDGFDALSAFDSNADGRIDAQDAQFQNLRIWRDLDSDGVSDAGELSTLSAAGVSSIGLDTTVSDTWLGGSRIGFTSSFERSAGGTGTAASVYLETDALLSVWQPPPGFVVSEAAGRLPGLHGFGAVKDLRSAMTLDAQLLQMVETFMDGASSLSAGELRTQFGAILQRWAGVEGVGQQARGPHVDARHLAFIEALYDDVYVQGSHEGPIYDPGVVEGAHLEAVYADFLSSMLTNFLSQVAFLQAQDTGEGVNQADFFALLPLNLASADDREMAISSTMKLIVADAPADPAAARDYFAHELTAMAGARLNLFDGDGAAVTALAATHLNAITDIGLRTYVGDLMSVLNTSGARAEFGTAAGDTLGGTSNADFLQGGTGDDQLTGAGGGDTYVYNSGDGADGIYDAANGNDASLDKLILGPGLNPSNLVIGRVTNSNSLTLSFNDRAGSIHLDNQTGGFNAGLEKIVFGDGAAWTGEELKSNFIARMQTAGNDTIYGFNGADTIQGGLGDDQLTGGAAADTYVYNSGDGADKISELANGNDASIDRLVLGAGLTPAMTVVTGTGSSAILTFTGVSGSILLDGEFSGFNAGVEEVVFADGTVWDRATLSQKALGGTTGNDTLVGNSLPNVLGGGLGDDQLTGAGGADTYVYSSGDGADKVFDAANGNDASIDKLVLGFGLNPGNLVIGRVTNSNNLTLSFNDQAGSIYLDNQTGGANAGIEQIVFGDGTTWSGADLKANYLIRGQTTGNDTLYGFTGADTFVYNSGDGADSFHEAISGADPSVDRLVLGSGLNPANLIISRITSSADLTFSFNDRAGSILLVNQAAGANGGFEQIVFGDGTTWTGEALKAAFISRMQTSGSDTIYGFSGADTFPGGAGDDHLIGAGGADTYNFNIGDGADKVFDAANGNDASLDRLVLGAGLNPGNLVIGRVSNSNNLTLSFSDQAGSIYLDNQTGGANAGLEQIVFGDGTIWTGSELKAAFISRAQTSGADTIYGFSGADSFQGGLGDDHLIGGGGLDTYLYNSGDGADQIFDAANGNDGSIDTMVLGTGLNPGNLVIGRVTNSPNLTLSFSDRSGSIYLDNQDGGYNAGLEKIVFGDGANWTMANVRAAYFTQMQTSGADTIYGFNGSDTITGGGGTDVLASGAGADRFVYTATSDAPLSATPERITDFASGADRIDLSAIDANAGVAADQAFSWLGTGAFTSVAGQLRYDATPSGSRTIWGDVDGDGQADFQIQLTGTGNLSAADFVL